MFDFLPQPKQITLVAGALAIPASKSIGVSHHTLYPVATMARELLGEGVIAVNALGVPDLLSITLNPRRRVGGYLLAITWEGIRLEAQDVAPPSTVCRR